jgi:hypothetical protein
MIWRGWACTINGGDKMKRLEADKALGFSPLKKNSSNAKLRTSRDSAERLDDQALIEIIKLRANEVAIPVELDAI